MVVQGEGAVEDDIELRGEWSSILVLCSVNRVFFCMYVYVLSVSIITSLAWSWLSTIV